MVSLNNFNESSLDNCEYKLMSYDKFSPEITSIISKVYLISAFLAFTGNVIVIIVELFGKLTNYNFRKFLINLAIADILTSVFCVPFSYSNYLNSRWTFPHFLCPVVYFVSLISVFVNTLTLTVISIERYLAVYYPFEQRNIICRNGNKILASIWILGSVYAYFGSHNIETLPFRPPKLYNQSEDQRLNITWYACAPSKKTFWNLRPFMTTNFVITYATPLLIITVCYILIARKLINIRSAQNAVDQPLRRSGRGSDTSKIIKMFFAVVILFAICWTPAKTRQLMRSYFPDLFDICSMSSYYWVTTIIIAFQWLSMAHSFVNPIIYSFMSKSFRRDLFDLSRNLSLKIGNSINKTNETDI